MRRVVTAVNSPQLDQVTVYTGDKRGAGTDARVFITLFGEMGDSGERTLDSARNNFQRAKLDQRYTNVILNKNIILLNILY